MKLILSILFAASVSVAAQTYQEKAVAAVLMGEAWNQGHKGMVMVAEVIRERTKSGRTPLAVVSERNGKSCAFSCLNRTTLPKLIQKFDDEPDFQSALQIARTLVNAPDRLPGHANGATHFTRKEERPYWAKGKRPVVVYKDHAFYRIKE